MSKLRKYKTFKGLKRSDKTASNSEERRAFMIADLNAFVLSIQDIPHESTSTSAEKLYWMKSLVECTKVNCEILNRHEVEYLIIGGTAVAIHGYARPSMGPGGLYLDKYDIDFWYNPTYENYFKLIKALSEIGFDRNFTDEKDPDPNKSFFREEFEDYKLDFLPQVKGLDKFYDAYKRRVVKYIGEVELSVISYPDLITMKEFSRREKDKIDIEMLRKINRGLDGK